MNLQGNGNNHNHRPNLNSENDSFLKFNDSAQYEKITGQAPPAIETDGTVEFGSEEERKRKLQEAIEKENSSAYDDLDDFIYKQNKRRARTSGRRHHHRHISPSVLSPGRVRKMKSDKKPHKHRHHYRKHHHKRMKRWQKVSLGIIITLLSIIIIGIVFIFLMYNSGKNALLDKSGIDINVPNIAESSENGMLITYKGKQYRYNENITNILCIGNDRSVNAIEIKESGGNQYATGGQADSLFLLTMDLETGENKVVNISRETMAEVNHYDKDDKFVKKNWKETTAMEMDELAGVLSAIDDFTIDNIKEMVEAWVEARDIKPWNAWRVCLVGTGQGPDMYELAAFLGKEETIRRMDNAIKALK